MVENKKMRKLDKKKIANRRRNTMSSQTALKEIERVEWSDDVLSGDRIIRIKKSSEV